MIKRLHLILVLILLFSSNIYSQKGRYGKISFEKATNISGKQRMLSQRIAKLFLLKKAGANGAELDHEYNSSIQLFARNLSILESNSKGVSAKVQLTLKSEKTQWKYFRKTLESKTQPSVALVMDMSNNLLKKAHAVVLAIEEESKFTKDLNRGSSNKFNNNLQVETVNISGKQRMLSQRLCLYYTACRLYRKEKRNAKDLCNQVEDIYEEMNSSLNGLLINDLNSFTIESNIGEILGLMSFIENNKRDFRNNKLPLSKIISLTNEITNLYNIVTGQYASL